MGSLRSAARATAVASFLALAAAVPAHAAIVVDEAAHTVQTPSLRLAFDDGNPEQLDTLMWGATGAADLAAGGGAQACGDDTEPWGEAYGDPAPYAAEVAAGSRGRWSDVSDHRVQIDSQIMDGACKGSEGEDPVRTTYRFFDAGPRVDQLAVTRRFGFGPDPTAFTQRHLRPYTPRMPVSPYGETLWPQGGAVQTTAVASCGGACFVSGWDGTWYAQNDPATGRGLLVLRDAKSRAANPARLAIDSDAASGSNNSSTDLLEPDLIAGHGWTAPVDETEYLCFYTTDSWTPRQRAAGTPPPWCGPAPTPQIAIAGATVAESVGTATLTVTRSNADAPMPSFDVLTADGTAAAATDYGVAEAGVFDPGATTTTVTVPIVDDRRHEDAETFTVALSDVSGATVAGGPATVTITDDDPAATPPATTPATPSARPAKATAPVTATSTPARPKAADYITLPSARACVSRRAFRIRLRQPKGIKIAKATVKLDGRLVKTVKGARVTAPVDLRGLPKGTFTVSIAVTTSTGAVVKDARTYRTCAPKRR